MNRFNFPTTIFCEPGLMNKLGELGVLGSGKLSGKALLVSDNGLKATDIPERVIKAFERAGIECALFTDIETNPDDESVEKAVAAYREAGANFIIGLGGGSPLDVAKTVAVRLNHGGPMEQYDDLIGGDSLIVNEVPPVIAIPTTAGTGSEVSRSSVIHIHKVDRKVVIFSPHMMPVMALLDPELTLGLPPKITAYTGVDALTHLIEAYVAKGYHPMADGIALDGIARVFKYLPEAYKNGQNVQARQEMLVASLMGAVAFQKGLGTAHSMAHPLSSVCGLHHGLANAQVLYNVTEFNRESIGEERFQKLSFAAAPDEKPSYETFMAALKKLLDVCDIPAMLSDTGVKTEHIDELVNLAMQDGCHQLNPRDMTPESFRSLFQALVA